MHASTTSDKVRWWSMGRAAKGHLGLEKALEMAQGIKVEGIRQIFLDGVHGRPRPRVRPRPID